MNLQVFADDLSCSEVHQQCQHMGNHMATCQWVHLSALTSTEAQSRISVVLSRSEDKFGLSIIDREDADRTPFSWLTDSRPQPGSTERTDWSILDCNGRKAMECLGRIYAVAKRCTISTNTNPTDVHLTAERHLWACAVELERQHGDSAFLVASMRIDELEAEGAFEGARTWRAILSRIKALEPDGGPLS